MAKTIPATVFTGSYGFEGCDPAGKIWARTKASFEIGMRAAIKGLREMYNDESNGQVWYVGPFTEDVLDIDLEEKDRFREMLEDMQTLKWGYVY